MLLLLGLCGKQLSSPPSLLSCLSPRFPFKEDCYSFERQRVEGKTHDVFHLLVHSPKWMQQPGAPFTGPKHSDHHSLPSSALSGSCMASAAAGAGTCACHASALTALHLPISQALRLRHMSGDSAASPCAKPQLHWQSQRRGYPPSLSLLKTKASFSSRQEFQVTCWLP